MIRRHGLFVVVIGPAALAALLLVFLSLRWRMAHDAALMMYLAYLIDHLDMVPYRDFFGVNLPGSYGASVLIGRLFGYDDFGFRLADVTLWVLISGATMGWLGRIDRKVGVTAVVLFTLHYFSLGQSQSLQREYILLLPISVALWIARPDVGPSSRPSISGLLRAGAIGLLFGMAMTIKPHAPIGLPVILLYVAWAASRGETLRRLAWLGGAAALGLAAPLLLATLYLWQTGGLTPFITIVVDYWPLFGARTGNHETIAGARRALYLLNGFVQQGRLDIWFVPAGIGLFTALFQSTLTAERRRIVWLAAGLAVAYDLYPLPAGQFFTYHWLPLFYFLAALAGLVWVERPALSGRVATLWPPLILVVALILGVRPPGEVRFQLAGNAPPSPKNGRVDAIAGYLVAHLEAGERVQPLDWTGGTLHAMLLARAPVATSFVYDFHFYHHVSEPTIQRLRERFLRELAAARPQLIVEVTAEDKPWVYGADTTRAFPALRRFLADEYQAVERGDGYIIYERLLR